MKPRYIFRKRTFVFWKGIVSNNNFWNCKLLVGPICCNNVRTLFFLSALLARNPKFHFHSFLPSVLYQSWLNITLILFQRYFNWCYFLSKNVLLYSIASLLRSYLSSLYYFFRNRFFGKVSKHSVVSFSQYCTSWYSANFSSSNNFNKVFNQNVVGKVLSVVRPNYNWFYFWRNEDAFNCVSYCFELILFLMGQSTFILIVYPLQLIYIYNLY